MKEIEQEVRQFVVENFLLTAGDGNFSNSDSFLETGLVDSMGILSLVEFVRAKYVIPIEDEELVPAHWDSVCKVAEFVQRKLVAIRHQMVGSLAR
jgi:acyl carrier protein